MQGKTITAALTAAALSAIATPAVAAEAKRGNFGKLADGRTVPAVTLTNTHGVSATLIGYGASLQALVMPDRNGHKADIALGYDTIGEYVAKPQFFGATVGRFANRIARGRFTLDGKTYQTPICTAARWASTRCCGM
jgi:aldose 1-epimerase